MKYSTGFIVTLDVDETFLDGGIAFAYAKGISPSNFLRNVSFGVIYTTERLHSKPQTCGEKDFPPLRKRGVAELHC